MIEYIYSNYKIISLNIIFSLLIVTLYHFIFNNEKEYLFLSVSPTEVKKSWLKFNLKSSEPTEKLTAQFSIEFKRSIQSFNKKEKVILVVKEAILSGDVIDITPEITRDILAKKRSSK